MSIQTLNPIERLRAVVGRYRITQQRIAMEIGIAEATLSVLLNGHREPSTVVALAISRWLDDHIEEYPCSGTS